MKDMFRASRPSITDGVELSRLAAQGCVPRRRFRDLPGLLPVAKQRHAVHDDIASRDHAQVGVWEVELIALSVVEIYHGACVVEHVVHRPFVFFTVIELDGDAAAGRQRLRLLRRQAALQHQVPAPGNFYVNLPPLFLGHFSPIFARFFPVFSPFSPSCRQDSGNRHQDPEKRSETVEKRRAKTPKLTLIFLGVGTSTSLPRT